MSIPMIALALSLSLSASARPERAPQRQPEGKGVVKWDGDFYLQPHLGLTAWSDGSGTTTASILGAEVGYRYWQSRGPKPRWAGRTRAEAGYVLSTGNAQGMDLRLGSFIGPQWRFLGLQFGPDVFWNRWEYGTTILDPTIGVGVPVTATIPLGPLTFLAGFEPAWLSNDERRVDWSTTDEFGFGHEFGEIVGVGLKLDRFGVFAGYSRRIVREGVQQGLSLGFNMR